MGLVTWLSQLFRRDSFSDLDNLSSSALSNALFAEQPTGYAPDAPSLPAAPGLAVDDDAQTDSLLRAAFEAADTDVSALHQLTASLDDLDPALLLAEASTVLNLALQTA